MPPVESGSGLLTARTELADLITEAAGGLSDGERAVLELSYQHGLEGADLAAALEVSAARARAMVIRLRQRIDRSLGVLLVARRAQRDPGACRELAEIVAGWDGQFTSLARKRISRHIESCLTCELDRRLLVTPAALLCAAPVFIPAPDWLREATLRRVSPLCRAPTVLRAATGGRAAPEAGRDIAEIVGEKSATKRGLRRS